MPSQESLRPHNTDVQVQTELIEGLGEKNKAYHVLEKIEARDVPKAQVDFTIKKEDYKGFSEAFSKALYGKGFQESTPREQNITLNVDLLLRHYGINTNQMHAGDKWHFDFTAQTFRFQGENGKVTSGRLEKPEATAIQQRTHEQLGDLHTSATARESADDVAPVDPTVLDVATEKGGGSLTETFRAFYNSDMGTVKARQEWLKSDPLSVAGINKYLRQLLGDKAQSQLLKEDGTGYRGTAEQNRAWMMYIRYDLMEIKDTKEEKDQAKGIFELKNEMERIQIDLLKAKFGEDALRYMRFEVANVEGTFTPDYTKTVGEWGVERAVVYYKISFVGIDGPIVDTYTYIKQKINTVDTAAHEIIYGIVNTNENAIRRDLAKAREIAAEKESSERTYVQFGEAESVPSEGQDAVRDALEAHFDDIEAHIPMTYGDRVGIEWGKEGKGKDKVRYVEVTWEEAYGENAPDTLLKEKKIRVEVPMKTGSTWKGQWPKLLESLQAALEADKHPAPIKYAVPPPELPKEDDRSSKDEPKEVEEKGPEQEKFKKFQADLDTAFNEQIQAKFADSGKYVDFTLRGGDQFAAKFLTQDKAWYFMLPYTISRTDTGAQVEKVFPDAPLGESIMDFPLNAQKIAEYIINANSEVINQYATEAFVDHVIDDATEPITVREYKKGMRDERRKLDALFTKDPALSKYVTGTEWRYHPESTTGEYKVHFSYMKDGTTHTEHRAPNLRNVVSEDHIAALQAHPQAVQLTPALVREKETMIALRATLEALALEMKQEAVDWQEVPEK